MKWSECYGKGQKPDFAAVEAFVGETLWGEFHAFMEANCPAAPKFEYSACTMQTGWNIKYKKAGKNVCTVYPMEGYLICMILIGGDGALEAEARLEEFTPYDGSPERVFPSSLEVTAVFEAEMRWRLMEEYGADSYEVMDDGKLLFRRGFTDRDTVFGWLLSFGSAVELVEPQDLREEFGRLIKEIGKKYNGDT